MADKPIPINPIPIKCSTSKLSPSTTEPSSIADTGMRKVTSNKFVAPDDDKMRKYNKYAKTVEKTTNPIIASHTSMPGSVSWSGRSIKIAIGNNSIADAVTYPAAAIIGFMPIFLNLRP